MEIAISLGERALRRSHRTTTPRVDADRPRQRRAIGPRCCQCHVERVPRCVSGAAQLEVARRAHLESERVEDVEEHLRRENVTAPAGGGEHSQVKSSPGGRAQAEGS